MNLKAWSWRVVAGSLLGLAVVPVVTLAQGQEQGQGQGQGQGRGGRGGGGFGGFGGGMMGGGMMGGVTGLVMMDEVRKELKLSEEQETKIREMGTEMMQSAFGGFGGRGGAGGGGGGNRPDFQNMSDEERRKFRDEMQAKVAESTKKAEESLKKMLTPEQNTRLNELRLQREGVQALGRAEVATALKLTDAQNEAIAEILEAARPQRGGPGGGGPGGGGFGRNLSEEERTKMREEMEARRKKTQEDVELVLTEEQKTVWTKMQGAKFEFPERPSFGGGGFGGFGRGGAGGGPGGGRRNRGGQGGEGAPRGGDRPARPPVDA